MDIGPAVGDPRPHMPAHGGPIYGFSKYDHQEFKMDTPGASEGRPSACKPGHGATCSSVISLSPQNCL